jgi:hypothetical protein
VNVRATRGYLTLRTATKQMRDDLKEFSVQGPFTVPLEPNKHGKMVAKDLAAFWKAVGETRGRKGVYVFGMRAGKGITPIYVGQAVKQTFEEEAFTKHKRTDHYNPALLDYLKGNPVMFFVVHPQTRGKTNAKLIDAVETFFIDVASAKNPDLSNVRKKPDHKWRVRGVVRGKPGEGSESTSTFKRAVGLR